MKKSDKRSELVSVYLRPEIKRKLKNAAKADGATLSTLASKIIEAELTRNPC